MLYMRVVKAGFAGSLREAEAMSTREIYQSLHFEAFTQDYERQYYELNKPEPGRR